MLWVKPCWLNMSNLVKRINLSTEKLFVTFDFWRIDKTLVKLIQKNDTLFQRKMFFCVDKRVLECIPSKTFLKCVNKILWSFIFFFIVEPLKEPFPFLKIDLNQNYLHNFSDMKKWHFCIDLHILELFL